MPTHDTADGHPVVTILSDAFAPQLESGEVDIVASGGGTDVDIQSDDWTLHLEGWPVTLAFIALDEEPATPDQRKVALDAALDSQHMAALRTANLVLDRTLVTALLASGDELSAVLAAAIGAAGEDLLDSLGG